MTRDSFPLRVKKEINNIKNGIEFTANNGEYEYYRPVASLKYLDEVIKYFKKEGFQVKTEEKNFKDRYMTTFEDDYLIISWKEQGNDRKY